MDEATRSASGSGGAVVGLSISAEESAEPVRVGFISGDEKGAASFVAALRDGLAAEGYHDPDTLTLDRLYADYLLDRIPQLVAELERRRVELIVTHAAATPIVAKGYRTVPVVYEFSADPAATGIAADLAHPLFNATGITQGRDQHGAMERYDLGLPYGLTYRSVLIYQY